MTGFWAWFHDAWEVIGALASAGAVIVAVWLARHERIDRKQAERERDQARAESAALNARAEQRERELQARHVVIWVVQRDEHNMVEAFMANYSSMPIFDARIMQATRTGWGSQYGTGRTLKPNEQARVKVRVGEVLVPGAPPREVVYALRFRDAAGNGWHRYTDGRLVELIDFDDESKESAEALASDGQPSQL